MLKRYPQFTFFLSVYPKTCPKSSRFQKEHRSDGSEDFKETRRGRDHFESEGRDAGPSFRQETKDDVRNWNERQHDEANREGGKERRG